jgi:hypothetical protein
MSKCESLNNGNRVPYRTGSNGYPGHSHRCYPRDELVDKVSSGLSYDKMTVRLVSSSGEEVVVELILSEPRKGSCH